MNRTQRRALARSQQKQRNAQSKSVSAVSIDVIPLPDSVRVQFSRPISFFEMPPDAAHQMASALTQSAVQSLLKRKGTQNDADSSSVEGCKSDIDAPKLQG